MVVDRGMNGRKLLHFRMRRNRNVPRSRCRNGRREVLARLVSQRPILRSSPRPRSFRAVLCDCDRLVTTPSGRQCHFIEFLRNFSVVLRSRVLVTVLSCPLP